MEVFSFDPHHRRPPVDPFLEPPLPVEALGLEALAMDLSDVTVRVVSLAYLIRLKEFAGRPQDLQDIERLRAPLPHSHP